MAAHPNRRHRQRSQDSVYAEYRPVAVKDGVIDPAGSQWRRLSYVSLKDGWSIRRRVESVSGDPVAGWGRAKALGVVVEYVAETGQEMRRYAAFLA